MRHFSIMDSTLSERDICTKFITPALRQAGWDEMSQIREEVGFTKGRIIVRGKLVTRGKAKRADYVLHFKPNIPLALIEAKDNTHSVADGMQQALEYAATLDIPFVFSSNGDGFVFHDRYGTSAEKEANLALDAFPSPSDYAERQRRMAEKGGHRQGGTHDSKTKDRRPSAVPARRVGAGAEQFCPRPTPRPGHARDRHL
jgi:type I site-specific restriction endonuclease